MQIALPLPELRAVLCGVELEEVGFAMSTRESVRRLLETAARLLKDENPDFGAAI